MIVPFSNNGSSAQQGEMPSEANLLMALAEMHKQGRFTRPLDIRSDADKPPNYGPQPLSNAADWRSQVKGNKKYEDNSQLKQEDEAISNVLRFGAPIPRPRPR